MNRKIEKEKRREGRFWKLRFQKSSGFSVMELLLVVAIIGTLVALVLPNLGVSRVKARNAERMSDLTAIQFALEQFYDDFGVYPTCKATTGSNDWCEGVAYTLCVCKSSTGDTTFGGDIRSMYLNVSGIDYPLSGPGKYIPVLPVDPINSPSSAGYDYTYVRGYRKGSTNNSYQYTGTLTDYILIGRLEDIPGASTFPKIFKTGTGGFLLAARQNHNVLLGND